MRDPNLLTCRYLLTLELARRWKLSPRTLERWRFLRVGPRYRRVGGRVIYALSDVEEFEAASIVETFR